MGTDHFPIYLELGWQADAQLLSMSKCPLQKKWSRDVLSLRLLQQDWLQIGRHSPFYTPSFGRKERAQAGSLAGGRPGLPSCLPAWLGERAPSFGQAGRQEGAGGRQRKERPIGKWRSDRPIPRECCCCCYQAGRQAGKQTSFLWSGRLLLLPSWPAGWPVDCAMGRGRNRRITQSLRTSVPTAPWGG